MLTEDAEDDGNEDLVSDLKKIHSAGKHLLSLINDVLDLSKIEAGRMDVYLESFEIPSMVDEVVATIATLVEKNDNRLSVSVDPTLGEMHADLTKVRQALFNLLSNAAKFTHQGEIRLNVQGTRRNDRDWIDLSVSDTGIGIPPEKIEAVFDEFSQADETTTRDYGGTGLGLSISRRFCKMMGGDITVESRLGEGSTFRIQLPARVDEYVEGSEDHPHPEPNPTLESDEQNVVLAIDDDAVALDLLERTLQGSGVRVVTSDNGRDALQLARSLHPIAITLDVMMPDMDGWEVLRELKNDPETLDIPVIMVTMTDDRELGYALGATEFLTKPIQRAQLTQLLERHTTAGNAGHALVVDDISDNREILRRSLESEGWRVSEAENGRAALERVVKDSPSLILLDLMMPVMDGFQFILEMRKLDLARAIPIVVVTAKNVTADERKRLTGDVVGLIEKSGLDRDSFLAQLRQQVDSLASKG
jgi:CheY-like chemotaxis protein/anti-sigma regulatory factor (Ser/Thr protein kinase)